MYVYLPGRCSYTDGRNCMQAGAIERRTGNVQHERTPETKSVCKQQVSLMNENAGETQT